MHKLTRDN